MINDATHTDSGSNQTRIGDLRKPSPNIKEMEQVLLRKQASQRTKRMGEATQIPPFATEPAVQKVFIYWMYTRALRLNIGILLNLVFHQRSKGGSFMLETTKHKACTNINNISKFSKETVKKRMEEMCITFRCWKINKHFRFSTDCLLVIYNGIAF